MGLDICPSCWFRVALINFFLKRTSNLPLPSFYHLFYNDISLKYFEIVAYEEVDDDDDVQKLLKSSFLNCFFFFLKSSSGYE